MIELSGMPGTISPDVKKIRWVRAGGDEHVRWYRADVSDGWLHAGVGHEPSGKKGALLWHISVSHHDKNGVPDRVPSCDELKHAFYQLVPVDVPMVLIFPRKSTPKENYVNVAETCLHLWEAEKDIDQ